VQFVLLKAGKYVLLKMLAICRFDAYCTHINDDNNTKFQWTFLQINLSYRQFGNY